MSCKLLTEFDEKLSLANVESMIVYSDSEMTVTFKKGSVITAEI
jgi:hypothetical protein